MLSSQVGDTIEGETGSPAALSRTWRFPACPFSIECSSDLLDQLRREVEGALAAPGGSRETGGVLFGRIEHDCVRISGYRRLECEHAMGPGFVLSEKDEKRLARLVSGGGEAAGFAGLETVGWYHSHVSSRIFLSERDRRIHFDHFAGPRQVALVLHPSSDRPTRAGFFFRESGGSMRTDASYEEFSLEIAPPVQVPATTAAPVLENHRRNSSPDRPTPAEVRPICPKCGSGHIRRSHRKSGLERIQGVFGYFPYRCHECLSRSMLKRSGLLAAIRPVSVKRPEERRRAWLKTRREVLLWGGGILGFLIILYYLIRDTGPKQEQP